jgi:hypothetical protein
MTNDVTSLHARNGIDRNTQPEHSKKTAAFQKKNRRPEGRRRCGRPELEKPRFGEAQNFRAGDDAVIKDTHVN